MYQCRSLHQQHLLHQPKDTLRLQQATIKMSANAATRHFQHQKVHTHTIVLLLFWNLSGTTRVSRYQKGKTRKGKTYLDLLEQETVSGSGICWAMCKSASHPRQPCQHPTTQFLQAGCPSCCSTNSIKPLKEKYIC